MNKKYFLVLVVVYLFIFNIYSKDNSQDENSDIESLIKVKEFYGIKFYPKKNLKVNDYLTIKLPEDWENQVFKKVNRNDVIGVFKCRQAELEINGSISIYKNKIKNFNKVVLNKTPEDIETENMQVNELVQQIDESGADQLASFFGKGKKISGIIPGMVLSTYYYNSNKKITIKVNFYIIYMKEFDDENWRDLLLNILVIYRSIKLI